MKPESDLLRVAYPSARNTQQTPQDHATTGATATQQASLKALARKVLECNNTRNDHATGTLKTAQQTTISEHLFVAEKIALNAFIELVRAFGASKHRILLHRQEIERQLDAADVQALLTSDRTERQAWAEMLAHRLCNERLQGHRAG